MEADAVVVTANFPAKLQPLFRPKRYKVLYGGRGGAKSWGIARALLIIATERPIRVLCTREVQKSIKDSVHRLLQDQIAALGYSALFEVTRDEIRCPSTGSLFLFAGLSDHTVDSVKSFEGVDIVWVEEGHSVTKRSWSILIPTIRKDGSEIWVSFNPELDTDETYVRFIVNTPPDCVLIEVNWQDNPWFPEVLRKEKDHLYKVDPEAAETVWGGKCRSSVEGAIYSREISDLVRDKRFRPVPHDPMLKVHTVWDLGWNDQMSIILAQRVSSEIRIVEYIEDSHKTLAEYVAILKERRFNWGSDFLPHDGAAKDYKTGKSAQEILQALGRSVQIVPRADIESGIKLARMLFPRVFFDDPKASRLVDCLKRYRRTIPVSTGEPATPLHDEYSHGADAFRYLAQCADRMVNENHKPINYPRIGVT